MSFFTKSYLTSEQLELSRIAASSSPSGPLDSSQQQSTSLLRSTRNIPPELRAPPYNPQQEVQEEDVEAEDPFNQRNKRQSQGEPTQVEDLFTEHPSTSSGTSSIRTETQEKERKRARTSQIGKMLFPSSSAVDASSNGSPRTKRHSYSGTASSTHQITLNPLSASTSSLPIPSSRIPTHSSKPSTRKTLSPSNAHQRTSSLGTIATSSSSIQSATSTPHSFNNDGSLLALPLAEQLRSLKERNAALAQSSTESNAQLLKAAERVKQLEENLLQAETNRAVDAEGWEAEASRLSQELVLLQKQQVDRPNVDELESKLSRTEQMLAIEQSKKRRAKEMIAKLKCEVINRRLKEKYEIELLEKEERNWEIRVVEVEYQLAIMQGDLSCERAEREELESIVVAQKKRIGTLSASRKVLLESFNKSEETITGLKTSLSKAQTTLAEREDTIKEIRKDIEALQEEVEEARTKSGTGETKLREKNEKLDAEIKDLKAQLKTSQTALKSAQKSSSSLESTQEALSDLQAKYDALVKSTSTPSVSSTKAKPVVKAKEQKRPQPIPEPESEVEVEEEEDEEEQVVELPSTKRTKTKEKEKKPISKEKAVEEEEEAEEDSQDTAKAAKEKAVKKSKSTTTTKKTVKKVVQSDADEEEDEDDEETPRPTPVSPVVKKRKAAVLSDKTTNASKEKGSTTATKVKKDKTGAGEKKKKLSLDLSEDERPAKEKKEKEEPAKKKKRKLFGDATKKGFDWQTQIENADVNGLIPGNLSPIKLDRTKKTGFLSGLGGVKKSIF
ncbi:hypothetical protein JCM3765_003313 [Sporobolomyces pararoseus]